MNKKVSKGKSTVTIMLSEEEKKVLFAIATNIYKQKAQSRNWKEVATRFGFANQVALKKFLLNEFSLPRANELGDSN
jgi:cytochrome oxidase assembly protein ShyY1